MFLINYMCCIGKPIICFSFENNVWIFSCFSLTTKLQKRNSEMSSEWPAMWKNCELKVDKEGKSRGMGIVQFDHPMEAVQAICILYTVNIFI